MQSQSSERTTVVWERTYCASEKNRIKKKKIIKLKQFLEEDAR